jgi:hypothetical protein
MSPPRIRKSGKAKRTKQGKRKRATQRRLYDSPVRQQQATDTRERIIAAGSELVHGFRTWDWRGLTFGAVARYALERVVLRAARDCLVPGRRSRHAGHYMGDSTG